LYAQGMQNFSHFFVVVVKRARASEIRPGIDGDAKV